MANGRGNHCLLDRGRVAGEREPGSVMRDVGGIIEQSRAIRTPDPIGESVDDATTTFLADVGHAFDQSHSHEDALTQLRFVRLCILRVSGSRRA